MADPSVTVSPAMSGGDASYSYTKHSKVQREYASLLMESIEDIIAEKLDIKYPGGRASNIVRIADLGCSVGPNTFFAVHNLIEAIKNKYQNHNLESPKFQVFFNDQVTNDFNTLFKSLPQDRQYFAAGVPGSFHDRLFPDASIDFVYSANALNYLSKIPVELLNKNSESWNKGRIHYVNAPDSVLRAYATQFGNDMDMFLSARAKEVLPGGMMVLSMLGWKSGVPLSQDSFGIGLGCLEVTLLDMVKQGLITEAQVDSFNIPLYVSSPEEMTKLVVKNGFFDIQVMELKALQQSKRSAGELTAHGRAAMEGMFSNHFGAEHVEELFNLLEKNTMEQLTSVNRERLVIFAALQRKAKEVVKGGMMMLGTVETIETKDVMKYPSMKMASARVLSVHTRSVLEGMFSKHFGGEHLEELFKRFEYKFKDPLESGC